MQIPNTFRTCLSDTQNLLGHVMIHRLTIDESFEHTRVVVSFQAKLCWRHFLLDSALWNRPVLWQSTRNLFCKTCCASYVTQAGQHIPSSLLLQWLLWLENVRNQSKPNWPSGGRRFRDPSWLSSFWNQFTNSGARNCLIKDFGKRTMTAKKRDLSSQNPAISQSQHGSSDRNFSKVFI